MNVEIVVHYSNNLSLTGNRSMIRLPHPPQEREYSYMLASAFFMAREKRYLTVEIVHTPESGRTCYRPA